MNEKDKIRQVKLNKVQYAHSKLTAKKAKLKETLAGTTEEIGRVNKELNRLGGQIFNLKNEDNDIPHITDHAVVRYLERVKGIDIWEVKAEIIAHEDSVRVENTIVTVNGNKEKQCTKQR